MIHFKYSILLSFFLILFSSFGYSTVYDQESYLFNTGDDTEKTITIRENTVEYSFILTNSLDETQIFNISIENNDKWDVEYDPEVQISAGMSQRVTFKVSVPDELGYKRIIDSEGLSKFQLDTNYYGQFDFAVKVIPQNVSDRLEILYGLDVYAPTNLPLSFDLSPSSLVVNPKAPISVRVVGNNVDESEQINTIVSAQLIGENGERVTFDDQNVVFRSDKNIIDVRFQIPTSTKPGNYDLEFEVKVKQSNGQIQSWELVDQVEVFEYEELDYKTQTDWSLWSQKIVFTISNNGNIDSEFEYRKTLSWYQKLFLSTTFEKTTLLEQDHQFSSMIEAGETKEFKIEYKYGIIIIFVFIVLVILTYRTYVKYKNPIEVDLKIEELKKVKHEGIKSFKIKLGFENIKEQEIDSLRVIYRMPSYLHVKDNSFSLIPPTKVLKGSSKYKLIWDFKRFEKGDSRIIGFELMNSKGVLGDIHFDDLEFEVEIGGKKSKYYTKINSIIG